MIYHHILAAVLAFDVAIVVGHLSPPLGKELDQLEPPLAIKAFAEPVYQKRGFSLKRQDLVGSWALRAVTCPSNSQSCQGGSPAMLSCCPKSSVCSVYSARIACCATSSRCDTTAATFPKCGDSSWSLWAGGRDMYFCCQSGQIGYLTEDDRGACGPDTLKPTGSQIATAVQAVSGDVCIPPFKFHRQLQLIKHHSNPHRRLPPPEMTDQILTPLRPVTVKTKIQTVLRTPLVAQGLQACHPVPLEALSQVVWLS
ncbi:hypothetical protein L211DRAFT_644623 [Terfezia boudieri ATCC MYA-4762]|uniref:Uncharacterized protein n=1 Tax=Terfezia boudieri ATCC MYA-4762 TaxID=1051890 RepID=A0A3N4LYH5_9PEZI|nr:hypothetical protein L211DRAFT_644623 [Terfezia boudieri ATCC MYA-4762]